MKVTSTKTVSFSKIGWGIHAGETRDLPEEKEKQEVILAHPAISQVGATRSTPSNEGGKVESEGKKL